MTAFTIRGGQDKPKPEPKPGLPADQAEKLHKAVAQVNRDTKNRPKATRF